MDYKIISFYKFFESSFSLTRILKNHINILNNKKLEFINGAYAPIEKEITFFGNSNNINEIKRTLIHELHHHYSLKYVKYLPSEKACEHIVDLMTLPESKSNRKTELFLQKLYGAEE